MRIVGVVRDARLLGPEGSLQNELYRPMSQFGTPAIGDLVIRTIGPAPRVATAVLDAIRQIPGNPFPLEIRFVDDAFWRLTADRRFNAGLMTIFGVLAIAIGAIGIYGTMAFVVAQQARAIGLRMALGATPTRVLRAVLRDALWRVSLGAVAGLVAARVAANSFTSLVSGVEATNPIVYGVVGLVLVVVGLLAALIPARRAARLDPLMALRAD